MRTCPFPDCYAELPDHLFACARHWHSMPMRLRVRTQEAYEAYQENIITIEQLRAIQADVMKETKAEPQSTLCRSCKARIFFAKTANGSQMPLDFYPVPDGNVMVNEEGVALVLKKADLFSETVQLPEMPRYKSHFSTCPAAAAYRKAGKKK